MSSSRSLGTLTIDLITKLGGFESGMDKAARTSKRTTNQIGDDAEQAAARARAAFGTIASLAAGALGGLSAGAVFGKIIGETKQAEQEQGQLAAVLRSTGEAAGYNRDQLNEMAAAMQGKSVFSAGEINQAQTALLAFTNVMGTQFVRAQQSAADMATRTGMSIQAASETIGRALDVPSQGLASLSRQGFRFTEAQKELVASLESTGRTAEAQSIILKALEDTYGGAAQAARDTFGGALDGIRNTLNGLLTGEDGSLEGARLAVEALNDQLSSPEAAAAFSSVVSSVATGAGLMVRALTAVPWEHAATAAGALAVVIGGRLAGSAVASALSMAVATVEAVRYQLALATMAGVSARAAIGLGALSVAARVASAAMAFLGGPLGVVITAAAAIAYFATRSSEAERETELLDGRIKQLDGTFKALTVNQAAAAIRDYTVKLDGAKANVTDLEERVSLLTKEIERRPNAPDFKEWQNALIDAKRDLDNGRDAVEGLIGKINELNALAAMPPAVPSAAAASTVYTEMSAKINEQILLIGKRTDADKLQARIGAGLVKGLADGEGEKLIALQKTADAKAEIEKADLAREAKAKSAAAAAITAAQSAAKATEQRAADAVRDYQRQIELINTTIDRRNQATESAKLGFDIESGKLAGISEQRKAQLRQLAAELDLKIKLKRENEDAAKLAAFTANLTDRNQTVGAGFDLQLAGAGMGDKYKERLKTLLEIQQSFNRDMRDLQKQQNAGEISQELYDKETDMLRRALEDRSALQEDFWARQDEAQSNWIDGVSAAWENYRDTAIDYQQQAAEFTAGTLEDLSSTVGNNIAAMALEGQGLGETFKNIASTMANSIINALAQMAAQWLVYQAVQLLVGKSTKAAAGIGMVGIAEATALQASLAAFASTAAIPIVGPAAAPAAAAAAAAFTLPLVAGVAISSMAGMAHDGIDSVPETGTWLLQKGERVTTAETSAKLDSVLSRIDSTGASSTGGPTINLIEDRSRAGRVERSQGLNKQDVIDIFVADIRGGGETADALEGTYPIRRSGR